MSGKVQRTAGQEHKKSDMDCFQKNHHIQIGFSQSSHGEKAFIIKISFSVCSATQ
jgi:hypothetical protein